MADRVIPVFENQVLVGSSGVARSPAIPAPGKKLRLLVRATRVWGDYTFCTFSMEGSRGDSAWEAPPAGSVSLPSFGQASIGPFDCDYRLARITAKLGSGVMPGVQFDVSIAVSE